MRQLIHLRQKSFMILILWDLVDLENLQDIQIHHLLVAEEEWSPEVNHVNVSFYDLHNVSFNLFRCLRVTLTISHHRKEGHGDDLNRVSEHFLTHKHHR